MDERQQKLIEDLSDSIEGEIHVDDVTTSLYATDASLYEIKPLAVVFPRHARDVELLAAWASVSDVPLIARGAGTGLAGGCVGAGVIVDFARHMNKVVKIDRGTVRVQPGITRAALNAELRPHGLRFAPDPSNSEITTIGGMIGVDAAGSHAFRIGSTRDHVRSVECVLMGGQRLELGQEIPDEPALESSTPNPSGPLSDLRITSSPNDRLTLSDLTPATRRYELIQHIDALLRESAELIDTHQPKLLRNCCGYMLQGVLTSRGVDFPRLLTGSEGTLGLITEATLHTLPIDRARGLALIMFGSLDAALQAMQLLLVLEPGACDLLDRRLLSLGRDHDQAFSDVIRAEAEAGLFLEFVGASDDDVQNRMKNALTLLEQTDHQFAVTEKTFDPARINQLWKLPANVVTLLAQLKGDSRPLPFVEDIAVPPREISGFLRLAQKTFQKYEVTATLYAHAASGQLHLRPIMRPPTASTAGQIEAIARELYRHVKAVGGTISGEHGDGLSRTAFIRSQYGPLYKVFQAIKAEFDPQLLLNPDKIISNDGQLTVRNLRNTAAAEATVDSSSQSELLPLLQLSWTGEEAMAVASRCNGCGTCRTTHDDFRMCPFFRDEQQEQFSPRSKANLIRRLVAGEEVAAVMTTKTAQELAESCFNCKQCQLECPSGVDVPHLLLEARAQHVAEHGLSKADWLLSKFHTYANLASKFTISANRLLRHSMFRRLLRRTIGIAERRRLPRFSRQPFLKSGRVTSDYNVVDLNAATPTVVYFVDYFANHHDPELAEAFVRILQHQGYRVHIPPQQSVSGMAMIAVGDVDSAREVGTANVTQLSEMAREGIPIVCSEPSAALCLQQEYPLLIGTDDANVVAEHTFDAGAFLWKLHREGKLKTDFETQALQVAYHTPCHVKALSPHAHLCDLLELIPGIQVERLEKGCSGMAGTFGLAAEHFDQSLQIGEELMTAMSVTKVQAGVTDCSSCRMQMEQEAAVPTIHPLKLIALAYGLMPEIEKTLKSRPRGNLMS